MKDYEIKTMNRRQVDTAVEWAAAEGWNPGLHDAECFFHTDPGGFLVGMLGATPVSVISVVRYGSSFGFLGFYIVRPEYRGRGFGIRIWSAGLERLRGRNIGLDGVVDQQDNYKRSGFNYAYRNIRYRGMGGCDAPDDERLVALSDFPFDDILAYDRPFFPDDRTLFLESWVTQPMATGLGIVENGILQGYGVLRPCRLGYKIGPLFADDPRLAETLFVALCAHAEKDALVFLDTPEVNQHAVNLAERHGMTVVFETARMYTGKQPDLPLNRLYGVTTFELG
ncbi:MAG: GNAT family N-acetyltransferase [Arenicellales bacterium]|nr:GNAT family N-acetyltransferase [Arenicellales bacterium]